MILGGLLLLTVGILQLIKAYKGSYLKHLEPRIAQESWAKWSGRLGYAARGIIFIITGFFLASAGFDEEASEAGDMAAALSWLTDPWDIIIAAGLFAFGLFSLIEARYRILNDVPVSSMAQRVKSKLT